MALIRREFITHLDGVNRFIANIAEGLRYLSHEVVIVSWSYRDPKGEDLAKWFKEAHGLDYEFEIYTLRGPEERDRWVTMMYEWFTKGSRLLRKLGADIAVVNGVVPLRFRPKIAVAHGPLVKVSGFQRVALKVLYGMYDYVVCVSEKSRREYKGIVTCDAIVPLPLKLKNFKPRDIHDREDVIVHIGTRPIKNPWISVRAVEILRERGHNVSLALIGSRSNYIEVLCKGKDFCLPIFDVDEYQKNEILCSAKALILPSSGEAFPYTVIEAMACGTPTVVSSAVPGDVIIHGYNGLRIESLNPVDYANALEMLLIDEDLWLNIHRAALSFVKRFDHIRIARKYVDIFNGIVGVAGSSL